MIFADLPLSSAVGAFLVHSVRQPPVVLPKGHRITEADLPVLRRLGVLSVMAARLEPGDVHEDDAAQRVARAVSAPDLTLGAAATGRVNVFAPAAGLVHVDRERLNRINRLDESITVATLPAFDPVAPGQMVATIKIIPFAAPGADVSLCEAVAAQRDLGPIIRVAAFREKRVGLIQTRLPGTSGKMLDKTVAITRQRLSDCGAVLLQERRCDHAIKTLAGEIRSQIANKVDLILIAGASAITDRRDVIPEAITAAGGAVEHFGMPVDPGNLLLLARLGDTPVLGLPGCARSPKLNGFDWVLRRICADIPVTAEDIMAMGVGGLLSEIPTRPHPRTSKAGNREQTDAVAGSLESDATMAPETQDPEMQAPEMKAAATPVVDAVVLAAGQSRRMGPANKLLCLINGVPLIRIVIDAVGKAGGVRRIHIVTGHDRAALAAALGSDTDSISFIDNPDYRDGLSTSVKAAARALAGNGADGVLLLLGDMPDVGPDTIRSLCAAFNPADGPAIVVPVFNGKRGNPVLWDTRFLPDFASLTGDMGAKSLIGLNEDAVIDVPTACEGVLNDIDTPEALAARGGRQHPPESGQTLHDK